MVFGSSFHKHLQRVEGVLHRIHVSGMKLKPEKCTLFQKNVTLLGYIVSSEGILPNPDNISKILQWSRPTTAKVRQLLKMDSFYRKFIKDFAK